MAETYRIQIVVDGEDRASGPLSNVGGALGKIGTIAGGILAADLLKNIAGGIMSLGKEALGAYASYERLGMSLQSLMAKELMNASAVENTTSVRREATNAEKERAAWLNDQIVKLQSSMEKLDPGSDGLLKAQDRVRGLQVQLSSLGIAADGYIYTTQSSIERTMSMTEAMEQATPQAEALQRWIQELAIQSPFKQSDVAGAFRLSMAYGFTSEQAQRMTTAMIDFSSATGASGDSMNRVSLALGQIKARGKLAGQEILQLTEAGLPVRDILAKNFGVTTAQLEKMISSGLVPADDAIEAIVSSLEEDFGGAAKRQAGTFSGLISSLSDIKEVGLREFFTGTFKAAQPYLTKFVDTLSDPATMEKISKLGEQIGTFVTGAFEWGKGAADNVKDYAANIAGVFSKRDDMGTGEWLRSMTDAIFNFLPADAKAGVMGFFDDVAKVFQQLQTALGPTFQFLKENGPGILATLSAMFQEIGAILVDMGEKVGAILGPVLVEVWAWILETVEKVGVWFNTNAPLIQGFFQSMRQILVAVFGYLSTAVQFLFQALANLWPFLRGVFEFAITNLQNMALLIMQVFTADWDSALETAKTIFDTAVTFIWDSLQLLATWVLDTFFGYTFEEGKAIVDQAVLDITAWFQNMLDKAVEITDKIAGFFTNISDAVQGIIDKIKEFFSAIEGGTLPGWVKTLFGIGDGVDGKRAAGGPVTAGKSYLVGEKGMELFTPSVNGRITPNHQLAAASGQVINNNRTFNINVTNNGGKLNERELAAAIGQWEWAYGV
jgi:tape measure domain-containing protein